ncbi:putative glutamine ABC transporter permease protein GlnP [Nocardioides dokdonensis FR1436]|uniref:Putative glutamine ABC transporter permease protein GlnP n=1 Tax=Nocardioides dokdonensis FR1436 TaxID=1300347 RepID=A0A1A9GKY0_9ACTN|nr:amino acid ABC transporter permease [Nocardioides dokdonensis]ANH38312.1 putative glutamine ABC transporter permease protein GlnP [Nocardioides dokdonensis FR1436]
MSQLSVLYDAPGPRAVRRARIGTILAILVFVGFLAVAAKRLNDRGQFASELWSPWANPSDENFSAVWELVGKGLAATLTAATLAIVLSLVLGVLLGVGRLMLGPILRVPVVLWIELFRALPVVVTIVLVWRAFKELKIDLGPLPGDPGLWYLVIGLTLYNSVIIAEILRAGVNSLPSGQGEAALAVGLTNGQTMRAILLPQAFRVMLPALISQLVVALKDTSLAAVVSLGYLELLRRGNLISQNLDNPIQSLLIIATIFILINYALSKLAEYVERRMSRSSGDPAAAAQLEGAGA